MIQKRVCSNSKKKLISRKRTMSNRLKVSRQSKKLVGITKIRENEHKFVPIN